MEKRKKKSCTCFSFFGKKSSSKNKNSKTIEISKKDASVEAIFQRNPEENYSQDHSLVTTQKLFSPYSNLKSTIMAPSCKTPQIHNILSANFQEPELKMKNNNEISNPSVIFRNFQFHDLNVECKFPEETEKNQIIKNRVLFQGESEENFVKCKESNLEKIEQNPVILLKEQKLNKDCEGNEEIQRHVSCTPSDDSERSFKIDSFEDFYHENSKLIEIHLETEKNEKDLQNTHKSIEKFQFIGESNIKEPHDIKNFECKDKGFESINQADSNLNTGVENARLSEKLETINEVLEMPCIKINDKNERPVDQLMFSPELENQGPLVNEKNLPVLEISPIKSMISADDYSDIIAALATPDPVNLAFTNIPDLFIRAIQKPKQMPLLKPTTPHYFSKKNAFPKMRRANKIFLDNLNPKRL